MTTHLGFSITDFARFSQTTRDTLLYYDRIQLFKPVSRAPNGYRYYSTDQLAAVNLIHTCQALGMPLSEIKKLAHHRTPAMLCELLESQITLINEKVSEWDRARKLLSHMYKIIRSGMGVDTKKITVEYFEAEPIILGEPNDYSHNRNDYDALLSFYHDCRSKYPGIDMNYPVWGYYSERRARQNDWAWPERYYFSNPDGTDTRPAGMYAVAYAHGGYGQNEELFARLTEYINTNGYEICGPVYEEYPLNEISVTDPSQYLTRAMATVRHK